MQVDKGRIINIKVKNIEKGNLASKNHCNGLLKRLVKVVNMTPISQPMCVVYKNENHPEWEGVSGVIVLAESHAAVHLWRDDKVADIMVNSCCDFNSNSLIEFCKEEFFTDDVFVNVDYKKG